MRRDRQADRVCHLFLRMPEQFSRHYGSRDDAVGGLIPTTPALFRSDVDESTQHLVTQDRSEDDVFPIAVSCVYHGQHGSQEIAWVAGNGTGVGVVKIEISDHHTVGESSEVG